MTSPALSTDLSMISDHHATDARVAPQAFRIAPNDESSATASTGDAPVAATDTSAERRESRSSLVLLPEKPAPVREIFLARQRWEGVVTHVGLEDFEAELRDLTDSSKGIVDGTFPFDEVAEEDRDLLRTGATFYWTIGYQRTGGAQRRVSEIRFRRLPAWTRADVEAVHQNLAEIDAMLAERRD